MRIILSLTKNTSIVPFEYQRNLVGAIHKWLGVNELHDALSLYSFSWLNNGKPNKNGLDFTGGSFFHISSHDDSVLKLLIKGINQDNELAFGMYVNSITIQENPQFGNEHTFKVSSPVFIKQTIDKRQKFYFHNDVESSDLLTKTLQHKLLKAGMNSEGVSVEFLKDYPKPIIKKINYNGIDNKGSICPVTIKGSPEQIAFAWNVGIGNSTGIGFGSLI